MGKYISFISSNTNVNTCCELGAGLFDNFYYIKSKRKIGIELIPEYIQYRKYKKNDCIAILGDVCNFEELLKKEVIDVFLIADFLEHLDYDTGVDLIKRLQIKGSRIIIFVPHGTYNQDGVKNYTFHDQVIILNNDNRAMAINAQRHKSTWYKKDFINLGFSVDIDHDWHPNGSVDKDKKAGGKKYGTDGGAVVFAIWNR